MAATVVATGVKAALTVTEMAAAKNAKAVTIAKKALMVHAVATLVVGSAIFPANAAKTALNAAEDFSFYRNPAREQLVSLV
jgi:uncharacterized membrane protein YgdD (TMEM256/DUF423 family)